MLEALELLGAAVRFAPANAAFLKPVTLFTCAALAFTSGLAFLLFAAFRIPAIKPPKNRRCLGATVERPLREVGALRVGSLRVGARLREGALRLIAAIRLRAANKRARR